MPAKTPASDPAAPPAEEAGREGTLFFANAPLVFLPGDAAELPVQDHKQMLTWTLTLIWSMVLLGAAGVGVGVGALLRK